MLNRAIGQLCLAAVLGALSFYFFYATQGYVSSLSPHRQHYSYPEKSTNASIQDISAEAVAYYTKILAWFTGALATVSIVQGVFLYKSVELTRRSIDLSERTAARQLRAYIGVREARVVSTDEGNTFTVEIELINAGPANHVTHHMTADLQILRGDPLKFDVSEKGRGDSPISPGETFILRRPIAIGGAGGVSNISHTRIIFAWGRVDYMDIFDTTQNVTFRCRSADAIHAHIGDTMRTIGWRMELEDDGNSAT